MRTPTKSVGCSALLVCTSPSNTPDSCGRLGLRGRLQVPHRVAERVRHLQLQLPVLCLLQGHSLRLLRDDIPTTNPSECTCETLTAATSGDTATGKGSTSTYSLKRTATGMDVVTSVSGVTCTGTYTTGTITSGAAHANGYMGILGWAVAASSALVLPYF